MGSKLIFSICAIHIDSSEYCNYLNFNCRVSSWPILIHFQYSTNIQRPVQLFQPKRASSKQTPTISNKADRFQAKFNFSEDNVHRFWPIEFFFQLKSPKSDQNVTISSETHIVHSLCQSHLFQAKHAYSKPITTISMDGRTIGTNCNYFERNLYILS